MFWLLWVSLALADTGLASECEVTEAAFMSLSGFDTFCICITWLTMTATLVGMTHFNNYLAKLRLQGQIEHFRNEATLMAQNVLKLNEAYLPLVLSQDKVNELIKLCHPNRHNNSKESNEMTKWLLAQRKKK